LIYYFRSSESAPVSQSGLSQSSAVTKPTLGQGLGTGLPSLTSGKKKANGKGSKDKYVTGQAAPVNRGLDTEANLSATLERLAEQTRHTVESIDAPSVGTDDMESFVKQFEALGGSQVLFKLDLFMLLEFFFPKVRISRFQNGLPNLSLICGCNVKAGL